MSLGHPFISPGLGPMTAVAAWQVGAGQHQRALATHVARGAFARLARGASFDELCALHRAATGVDPHQLRGQSAASLSAAIDAAIATGKLLVFAGWTAGAGAGGDLTAETGDANRASPDSLLIRKVMGAHAALQFQGSRYRFVAVGRRFSGFGETGERPLPLAEARKTVAAMSDKLARGPSEEAAWEELAERLTDDERKEGIR